jgi:hypothetical protein
LRLVGPTRVATLQDDLLKARPQAEALLTSEGASPSVLTSDRRERADKPAKQACC